MSATEANLMLAIEIVASQEDSQEKYESLSQMLKMLEEGVYEVPKHPYAKKD